MSFKTIKNQNENTNENDQNLSQEKTSNKQIYNSSNLSIDCNQNLNTILISNKSSASLNQNAQINQSLSGLDLQQSFTRTRATKKSQSSLFCNQIVKLLFSNVGLVLVVFLYSTFGALMFQLLEQHEEFRLCEGMI